MSQYKVIGITGPAGCGKDTVADYLLERLPCSYRKRAFAQPIKEMAQGGLGLSLDQVHGDLKDTIDERYGVTPRRIMQTLGTEWGRNIIHPNVWVFAMAALRKQNFPTFDELVIPDVRFENEANYVRQHGKLIHIVGRNDNGDGKVENHVSESGVEILPEDIIIRNDDLLETFHDYINEALKYL